MPSSAADFLCIFAVLLLRRSLQFSTLTLKRQCKDSKLASQPIPRYLEGSCCKSFLHVLCGFSFLSIIWG